jgi:hypothetical protein
MAVIIRCECEAVYEQIVINVANWVEDSADCQVCGHELSSWRGNKVLSFDLIKNPTE